MAFDPNRYTHDSDRAALKALKAIPGFSALTRGFMNVWNEPQQRILNMSSRIRLGEDQMKKYYDMLPPISEKLGIAVPELYIELNVVPNAYTYGDTNPFIVMTSGLLETIPDELIPTVLAHECGHIACRHTLYRTMGRMILSGSSGALSYFLKFGSLISVPLQIAFYYWMRCSEYTADRAAVLCDGTAEMMQEVCMRLAGWDKDIKADANMDSFLRQASEYREMVNGKKWNKTLEYMILSQSSHPLTAVRAIECAEWTKTDEYFRIVNNLPPADKKAETSPARLEDGNQAGDWQPPFDLMGILRQIKPEEGTVPENMQICKVGKANETFYIPAEYQKVKSMPEDPEDSVSYGLETDGTLALLTVYPEDREKKIPYDNPGAVIDGIHRSLDDDQGLIEVNSGITAGGKQFIYSIVKNLKEKDGAPAGVQYFLMMNIEGENQTITVRAFFDENGTTGLRDSAVFELMRRDNIVVLTDKGADGWNADPYDPAYNRGALMNLSENEAYDDSFPSHPLTEARKTVRALTDNN